MTAPVPVPSAPSPGDRPVGGPAAGPAPGAGVRIADLALREAAARGFRTPLVCAALALAALAACRGDVAAPRISVRGFGAAGDGRTFDTAAIQRAIDAAGAAGGGTVTLPAGRYLSGTIRLRTNTVLRLEAGATLLGSTAIGDYEPPHLIMADDAVGMGIEGSGTIDGQGEAFWDDNGEPLPRPEPFIELRNCRDVMIRGVRIRNSPAHTINLKGCRRVWVDGIDIEAPMHGPNTDGIDVDGSSDVFISNSRIVTGDDAICPKASAPDSVTENLVVTNCVLTSDDAAIKLGTASAGTIRNCLFSNIAIRDSRYGISMFMKDGGLYEDIRFTGLSVHTGHRPDRPRHGYPIFFDVERRRPDSPLGRIRHVVVSDVSIATSGHALIAGDRDAPIEDLALENVVMRVDAPADTAGLTKPRGTRTLKERAANDVADVPSHFTFANVRGLRVAGLRVLGPTSTTAPFRHLLWGRNLEDVVLDSVRGRQSGDPAGGAVLSLSQCQAVEIRESVAAPGSGTFLALSGAATADVVMTGNDLRRAREPLDMRDGADPRQVATLGTQLPPRPGRQR